MKTSRIGLTPKGRSDRQPFSVFWRRAVNGGNGAGPSPKEDYGSMRSVLRNHPSFARLFLATLISEVGNKIHRIALLVLIYQMTEQALWVSLALAVQLVTTMLVGPLISAWADAQERRRLLVASEWMRVPLVILIPLLGTRSLAVLLVLMFMIEIFRNINVPVAGAVIPDLVREEEVDTANGLMMFTQRFAEVAFVGLAGALVGLIGAAPAFWVDAVTFLASGLILLGLPRLEPGYEVQAGYWAKVREGVAHLTGNAIVRRTVGRLFVAAMFGSVEAVLGVVLAVSILQVGSAGFGLMESAMALGAVLGAIFVPRIIARAGRERIFILGLLLFGLFEASIGVLPIFAWVLVVYFASGILNMFFLVPARSILQLNTPPELRTRTFAAFGAVINGAVLFGTMLGGALEEPLGAPLVFVLAGLMVFIVSLSGLIHAGSIRASAPSAGPIQAEAGVN